MEAIVPWYYARLAELIEALRDTPEADGSSLLDHSLVWTTNEYGPNGAVGFLEDPSLNHSHETILMPFLLFGRAGGALRTGRNLIYDFPPDRFAALGHGRDHTQLMVSMLQLMGQPDTSFGDPAFDQGPLPGLV
jgi:hypothetical protein